MCFKKKLTSIILSLVMVLGFGATSFAYVSSDAKDSKYKEAIELLGALEIMVGDKDTGAFRPDDTIKRSEFAKVAVTSMGMENLADSFNHPTQFPDVVSDHWANGYINVAANQGIVIGDDLGNFRPDDTITYAEAVTVLVRLIGHSPVAEKKGGFPTGYVTVATQAGITKNAVASNDSAVLRGMVAQLTANALVTNKMEQTNFGSDESYQVVDKTLLSDELSTQIIYDQMTAIGTSSLTGTSTLKNDEVKIGSEVYDVKAGALATARRLLGFNVEAYVKEDDHGDKTLILAREQKGKNASLKISAEDIETVANDTKVTVKYWLDKETDKTPEEAQIAADAKYIYNGKAISFDIDELKPEAGSLTLLDRNRDDVYDVVFIEEYENYVVEEVITSSNRITDKYGKTSLVLDPEDDKIDFVLTHGGSEIKISDIKEWDVLSVAKSKDSSIVIIEVSKEKVTGKITEKHDDKFVIDGKEYGVSKNYPDEIKLNDEGTFYLDKDGKIAAVDAQKSLSSNYAYLTGAEVTTGFDKRLNIKVFDKNGKIEVVKSGEKIRFNNTPNKTPEEVLEALKKDGKVAPALITFEVNSDGELTKLNTATDKTAGGIDKNIFALNASGTLKYKASAKKLGNYGIDKDTIVFDIPAGELDAKKYSVTDYKLFEDNTDYDVLVYDVSDDLTAGVVIVTNSTGIANLEASAAIVEKISTSLNEDGDKVEKLYAFVDGEKKVFTTADEGILVNASSEQLKAGDIIQLKTNAKGEIESIRVLFEAKNMETEAKTTVADDLVTVYGKVVKKFTNSINVSVNGGAVENYSTDGAKVYEFNSSKTSNPIKVAEAGDITQYDELDVSRVFIRIYKDEVKEIVIVR